MESIELLFGPNMRLGASVTKHEKKKERKPSSVYVCVADFSKGCVNILDKLMNTELRILVLMTLKDAAHIKTNAK